MLIFSYLTNLPLFLSQTITMKVIIVGGGIAGLTFANALEKAGVDFILLEARPLLDPQVGASIGLAAPSLRILDQFGAAQEIIDQTVPLCDSYMHAEDGKLIRTKPWELFQQIESRHSYGTSFIDRQLVLRAMANAIHDKDKLLLKKRLKSIDHKENGVTVHCEDGTSYDGDMVVGCDGVHSKTRQEMWRIASETDPTYFPPEEKTKMTAEFRCLFGISEHVPGFDVPGTGDTTFGKGNSFLMITGKDCRLYWFLFQKLDRLYRTGDLDFPRYTMADAEKVIEENSWRKCSETITLGDVWKTRVSYTLVAMEECLYEKWSWGRIATIGDNAHKMTANHGQAGNNAVESAAGLANQLKRLQDDGRTDQPSIDAAFHDWRERRRARISATVEDAAVVCRMQALDSTMAYIKAFYLMSMSAFRDMSLDGRSASLVGCELLEYLPIPERAFRGSMPFNQHQGIGRQASLLSRAVRAAPLLLVACLAARCTSGDDLTESFLPIVQPIQSTSTQWWQAFSFLVNKILLLSIWLIESQRRSNSLNFIRLQSVFGVLSGMYGLGIIAPVWMFFHYLLSGVDRFGAGDNRLTRLAYTKTVLPLCLSVLLLAAAPKLIGIDVAVSPEIARWMWIVMPLCLSIAQKIIASLKLVEDTSIEDVLTNWTCDYPILSTTLRVLTALSALTAFGRWYAQGASPSEILLLDANTLSNIELSRLAVGLASAIWAILHFYDLEVAGMLSETGIPAWKWSALLLSIPFLPLTTIASGCWLVRETQLMNHKEKHAMTKEKYVGKSVLEVDGGMAMIGGPVNRPREVKHEKMNGHTNGHADGGLNEHTNGALNGKVNGGLNGHANRPANGHLNGHAE